MRDLHVCTVRVHRQLVFYRWSGGKGFCALHRAFENDLIPDWIRPCRYLRDRGHGGFEASMNDNLTARRRAIPCTVRKYPLMIRNNCRYVNVPLPNYAKTGWNREVTNVKV
ncbi:hypothetical protein L209DRAFT_392339 [Thermothelomyces heterothallicus CBS 203.75]